MFCSVTAPLWEISCLVPKVHQIALAICLSRYNTQQKALLWLKERKIKSSDHESFQHQVLVLEWKPNGSCAPFWDKYFLCWSCWVYHRSTTRKALLTHPCHVFLEWFSALLILPRSASSGCPGLLERQAHAEQKHHKALMVIETEFCTTQRDTERVKASGQCVAEILKLKGFWNNLCIFSLNFLFTLCSFAQWK